jgi:hypothetical protein
MARVLTLVSFSCVCGAEVHLQENPTDTTEIICVACGEWIGVHAELLPAPKKKQTQPKSKVLPKSKVQAKSKVLVKSKARKKLPARRRG